ncbi:O-antigen ligase family protein [Oscillatoria amoena NRMC-F 0135]|nr:O-antigen ligase family protein [Oscillatoria laete-virens]MDL5046045.1 O-antigen ligase family protein [Oscillatoria amoena NRMC-F 0135]MDL5052752.1 O-antigen ligase family protein [Oscillatoria laete-virens NRMC-F 0139]
MAFLFCALTGVVFLFAPPVLEWNIADVGERQGFRETLFLTALFLFSVAFAVIPVLRQMLLTSLTLPAARVSLALALLTVAWLWSGTIRGQTGNLGIAFHTLWFGCLVMFFMVRSLYGRNTFFIQRALFFLVGLTSVGAIWLLLKSMENGFFCPNVVLNTIRLAYGEFMVVGWAVSVGLLVFARDKKTRMILAGAVFMITLAIFQTAHRSPVLGMMVSLALLLWWVCRDPRMRPHLKVNLSHLGLAIVTAILLQWGMTEMTPEERQPAILQERLLRNEEGSIGYRIFLGTVAWQMAMENPIAGKGSGTFGSHYFSKQLALADQENYAQIASVLEKLGAERTHNEFLQLMAENGFVGLLLVVGFIGFVWVNGWQMTKRTGQCDGLIVLAAAAGFLACSVTSGFSWRWASNGIVFFLLLGLLPTGSNPEVRRESRMGQALLLLAVLGLFLGAYWQIRQLSALLNYARGFVEYHQGRGEEALPFLGCALEIHPDHWRSAYIQGRILLEQGRHAEALESFEMTAKNRINGTDHLLILARLSEKHGNALQQAKAEEYYFSALKAYPDSPWPQLFYADYLARQGQRDTARALADQVKQSDPAIYSALREYFRNQPDQGRQIMISNGKIIDLQRAEFLFSP